LAYTSVTFFRFSEGTVEAIPLVAVAVDEKHHLAALGALFTALGDHLPHSTGRGLKSVRTARSRGFVVTEALRSPISFLFPETNTKYVPQPA